MATKTHLPAALSLSAAAALLRRGGVLIYPTETFYALGAMPHQAAAVQRLLALKGREAAQGLPLIAAGMACCWAVGCASARLQALAAAHWPGPLTLCLPLQPGQHLPQVSAADASLALRCSSHAAATALAAALPGGLLVATSANRHGAPPAAQPDGLDRGLLGAVDGWVDGGALTGGLASTLVRETAQAQLQIVRAGAYASAALQRCWQRLAP